MEEWEIQQEKEKRLIEALEGMPSGGNELTPTEAGTYYRAQLIGVEDALREKEKTIVKLYLGGVSPGGIANHFAYLQPLAPSLVLIDVVRNIININDRDECQECYSREPDQNSNVVRGKDKHLYCYCIVHRRKFTGRVGRPAEPKLKRPEWSPPPTQGQMTEFVREELENYEEPIVEEPPEIVKGPLKNILQQYYEEGQRKGEEIREWARQQKAKKQQEAPEGPPPPEAAAP